MNSRKIALFSTALVGALVLLRTPAPGAAGFPNDSQTIRHVLNRIGFGPRPGDVERVQQMGVERYIDEQLHPERIADSGMSARLGSLKSIGMSNREISIEYERPQLLARRERQLAGGQAAKQGNQNNQNDQAAQANQADQNAPTPEMRAIQQRANSVIQELSEQKMLRAAYSERQLQEVLTDFWFNHFNVDARKGRDRFMLTAYERETIRPHVLGKFRDLLEADAKSPAMLFYLDNWMSADPNGPHPDPAMMRRPQIMRRPGVFGPLVRPMPQQNLPPRQNNRRTGLNENYGRELMELHTLGVDGGYTQKDVTEVARAFTGWTISNPQQGADFQFEPRIHDQGEKTVLGHTIKAGGGMNDGEQVLDILARHPSTAHFISLELARRFVSDTPPPALVDRVAARFRETDGDLREVTRTILTSPEFLSADAVGAKVKTPLEFITSAVRATGADVSDAMPLVRGMQQLGMPLYQCQPPTGYKDTADAWTNTGALVNRMNFALQLASGRMPGTALNAGTATASGQAAIDAVLGQGGGSVSDTTRATVEKATTAPQRLALVLGSPEFQKR